MRNTQIQQQRNQHESSQKLNTHTHTQVGQKESGEYIAYKARGEPQNGRGENTSFKRRRRRRFSQIESLQTLPSASASDCRLLYCGIEDWTDPSPSLSRVCSDSQISALTPKSEYRKSQLQLDLNERCNFYDLSPLLL